MAEYERWLKQALIDKDLTDELISIKDIPEEINDRFYRKLEFGTGGLRGIIGAGTNRMNVYTVGMATQGLANYLLKQGLGMPISVAIAHDSRNKGVSFSKHAASVLAANGIHAYIYPELMPTPALSFAVRHLKCAAGICVTASHNPAQYNGYKAYDSSGCQITSQMAADVMCEISKLDIFEDIKTVDFEDGIKAGTISYIEESVTDSFIEAVYSESLKKDASNLKIVYTPLNGSGKKCVLKILEKICVKDITLVAEQSEPDGNFPTCPYPNPEIKEALKKGLELCEKVKPDLLLATDPDCDRVGIAVNNHGQFSLLTGNEVGILMLEYIAKIKTQTKTMPKSPVAVTTIVSTDMVDAIAKDYGIEIKRVLTGFKYIGDAIAGLEAKGMESSYLLGFEESYGYLSGGYVRDKDAVNGSMIICEMASYYKEKGMTLLEAMNALYKKYGYYINTTLSFTFEGENGMKTMDKIMSTLREGPPDKISEYKVIQHSDYLCGIKTRDNKQLTIDLPKSDVLEYKLDAGGKLTVRPSGTEPKLKIYLSAAGKTNADALKVIESLKSAIDTIIIKH